MADTTEEDLAQGIIDTTRKESYASLDTTKSTFLTAGLLVAVSLINTRDNPAIFGIDGIKFILIVTIISAICHVLSYTTLISMTNRLDSYIFDPKFNFTERFIFRIFSIKDEKQIDMFNNYWVHFINGLSAFFNNMSTLFLIGGLVSFLYAIVIK